MVKKLPQDSGNPPVCSRKDSVCPAYELFVRSSVSKDLSGLAKKFLNILGNGGQANSEAAEKIRTEGTGLFISAEALKRQIAALERDGQLCENCPYKERK
jgi:hypothetical protein